MTHTEYLDSVFDKLLEKHQEMGNPIFLISHLRQCETVDSEGTIEKVLTKMCQLLILNCEDVVLKEELERFFGKADKINLKATPSNALFEYFLPQIMEAYNYCRTKRKDYVPTKGPVEAFSIQPPSSEWLVLQRETHS